MGIIKSIWNKIKDVYNHNPLRFITYSTVGVVISVPMILLIVLFFNLADNGFDNGSTYFNGVRPTIIVTESMEPVIMVNSIIMIEDVEPSNIEPGDIIRYESNTRHYSIVHRVVAENKEGGYFITKGDNNERVDSEKVYYDMVNGRVTSINNSVAPIITFVFGRLDMENFGSSMGRAALGMLGVAVVLVAIMLSIYGLYELITINAFWYYRKHRMINSIDWMDLAVSRKDFSIIIDNYKAEISRCNILKRIVIYLVFMKYYDILCTVESHVKRADKWRHRLERLVSTQEEVKCSPQV